MTIFPFYEISGGWKFVSAAITIKMSEATPARETGIGLSKIC